MGNERRFELVAAGMVPALPRRAGEVQPAALPDATARRGVKPYP
jgi:hypothetical protein